jgi:short-subunit dehydrogenase
MAQRQTALVTGASSGIGLALAQVFAREGYDLVISCRHPAALETVRNELSSTHYVSVYPIVADLAAPGGADELTHAIARAGLGIHVLVNNAGVGLFGVFTETRLDEELRMMQLNMASIVTLTKHWLPGMVERGAGGVLNVASTAGFLPGPHMAVYYATKAFVLSFSEAIADELRDTGVKVSVLCPGPTISGFQAAARMQRSRLMQRAMMDTATVAEAGYRGLMSGTRVIVPGMQNKTVPLVSRLLPRRLVTILSRRAAEVAS